MQGNPLAPHTWRLGRQPDQAVRISRKTSLSKGLLRLYDPTSPGYPAEYVRGSIASTWTVTNSQVAGAMRGVARVSTAGGGNCNSTDNGFINDITNQMTVFWFGEWVSGNGHMVFECANSGATAAYNWGIYADSLHQWTCYIRNTSLTAARPVGPVAVANTPVFVIGTYNGSTINLYIDGIWVANVAQSGNVNNVNYPIAIGDYWAGLGNNKCYLAGIYNRALSAAEVFSLAKDPYQLLEPVPAAMIGVTSSGGGTAFNAAWARNSNVFIGGLGL